MRVIASLSILRLWLTIINCLDYIYNFKTNQTYDTYMLNMQQYDLYYLYIVNRLFGSEYCETVTTTRHLDFSRNTLC